MIGARGHKKKSPSHTPMHRHMHTHTINDLSLDIFPKGGPTLVSLERVIVFEDEHEVLSCRTGRSIEMKVTICVCFLY